MRVLFILMLAILAQTAGGADVSDSDYEARIALESDTFVSCDVYVVERLRCERIQAARERLKPVTLGTFDRKEVRQQGKKSYVVTTSYRQFALMAYDPAEDRLHDIRLAMPQDVSKQPNFQPIVETDGYQVTRIYGSSLNKMRFKISYDGRELFAYAGKHLLFTKERQAPLWGGREYERVESVIYLATAPYLVNDEFAREGQALYMRAIEEAIDELRHAGVRSLAYPGRLLADVFTASEVANLLVAEQTDPCLLQKRSLGCKRLIPELPYASDDLVRQAVNAEFAINGLKAFRYMRSIANARGALQFTNNPNKRYAGTYSAVIKQCPGANIDPDFRRGTMSLHNLAKAAVCLIDLELSHSKLPGWVREAFLFNREIGMLFPGAAYNGGPSQSKTLSALMMAFDRLHGPVQLSLDAFPWKRFFDWIDQSKPKLSPETRIYIEKIIDNWQHLHRHRPKTPVVTDSEGTLA